MAGKKIGLVLALDGEKEFTQAVQNAKKEAGLFKTELKNLSQQFEGNANSMEALKAKQEALTNQQEAFKRKLEASKIGLENAKKTYNQQSDALADLKKRLEEAQKAQKKMEDSGDDTSDAYKEQCTQVEELSQAVDKQNANVLKASGRVTDWNKKVSESEGELKKTNSALDQNEKYLKEAESATDKCATSIDGFGKEVKETASDLDNAGKKTSTFKQMLAANLTGTAIVGGLKAVGNAAKEAAEYAVEVGSSFEAAMSEVAAISGASSEELEAMTQKAKELGSSTKFSASEAASAFTNMSLAGWSVQQSLSGIDGVMQLAAASGMDLADASQVVTDNVSSFGLAASDAMSIADMMAFAQANNSTTAAELGEAYKNCAANMNAAGQDIETTTSLLESLANNGLRGSEAGTALSAMMRDMTSKMKDGAIAIGDTTVEVMDAQGNFRDMTDIVADLEKATDGMGDAEKQVALQSTFTSDSIKGLNMILNTGSGQVADYETALRNCDGAASDMADTMQNNLEGDLTTMNSALEGLGIAAYDYVDGPLRRVVQGVTGIITGITDAITPQKTEVEQFVEDIKSSNDEIQSMLDNASQIVESADIDVSNLEAYKQTITELNDLENASGIQKYELQQAVNNLAGDIPELAAAWDTETERINLSKDAIVSLIDQQIAYKKETAASLALQETYNAKIAAEANQLKINSSIEDLEKRIEKTRELNEATEDFQNGGYGDHYVELTELENALDDLKKEQKEANKAAEEAVNQYDNLGKYVDKVTQEEEKAKEKVSEHSEELDALAGSSENAATATESLGDATEETSEKMKEVAKAGAEAQKTAMDEIVQAYDNTKSEIESRLQDKISLFDMFDREDGGEDMTVEQITENLNSQIEAFEKYQDNLEAVKDHVGKEITPEFMQYIESMGMDGANTLEHILQTFADEEPEKVREMCEKWTEAMDQTEQIAKVGAANQTAYELAMGELGSTEVDFSVLEDSIESASASAAEGWKDLAPATKAALDEAVQAAKDCGIKIPDGLAEGIASGEVSAEEAISQLNGAVQGTIEGVAQIAKDSGLDIGDNIIAGIEAGGPDAINALKQLLKDLEQQKGEAQAAGETVGDTAGSSVKTGMENQQGQVEQAADNMAQSAVNAVEKKGAKFRESGLTAASKYATGIFNGSKSSMAAATNMAAMALSAAQNNTAGFYSAGVQAALGMAMGISAGSSNVIAAATNMAARALAAAKAALDIHSPSRKFKEDVGKQIAKGMAFGISDNASLAGKAATQMSSKVYANATSWMKKYKKSHSTTLDDEIYFWKQVQKHTKAGTAAYNKVVKNIQNLSAGRLVLSGVDQKSAAQITKNFGVSRTTTTGSGKNKKTVKKDNDTYYGEIYSAAEKYFSNQQILNEWSLQQQLAYWNGVKGQLKSGTQAWYDATAKIQDTQEAIEDAAKERIRTQANVQKSILEKYKVYNKMSAKAEMEYWDTARKQFAEGTDERIEADDNYLQAKEEFYEQQKNLDEDYAENERKIIENREKTIQELEDTYHDAVNSRKKDILSSMDLFEAWDAGGYTKDVLSKNLKTQVDGLKFWEKQIKELESKNVTKDLLEELKDMGPDAAASIWSLNQMTAEELDEYNALWTEKNELAHKQALKDNEDLLKETNDSVEKARKAAQEEMAKLKTDYDSAVADLNKGLSDGLKGLVDQAANIGEEIVSKLVDSIKNANTAGETQKALTEAAAAIQNQAAQQPAADTSVPAGNLTNGNIAGAAEAPDQVLEIINSQAARSKNITKKEKKKHSALWQYIAQNYGRSITGATAKEIADELGVEVSKSPSRAEQEKILKKLKERGYASGTKRIEKDGEYWLHDGELLVRKQDNATLRYLDQGDGVIPANLTENLMKWGRINPAEYLERAQRAMEAKQAAIQEQMNGLNFSGIAALNRLMENQRPQTTTVNVDNSNLAELLGNLIGVVDGLRDMISGGITLDDGTIIARYQKAFDREAAAVAIRRNRGRF